MDKVSQCCSKLSQIFGFKQNTEKAKGSPKVVYHIDLKSPISAQSKQINFNTEIDVTYCDSASQSQKEEDSTYFPEQSKIPTPRSQSSIEKEDDWVIV